LWCRQALKSVIVAAKSTPARNLQAPEALLTPETDAFKHSTPELYDRYMGPLLFVPYAKLLAERSASLQPSRILETAAGTGIVTRAVNEALPEAQIVATDVNPAVLEFAASHLDSEQVTFQPADAQDLPFAEGSFDFVLCAFGVMFFPDKVRASEEARRVLRSGGRYLLVSFDRLALNPVPKAAGEAVAALFPDDPPLYMERGPFSYADPELIEQDLRSAGFTDVALETVALSSHVRASDAAQGIVLGSPCRSEIERRDSSALDRAVRAVTEALLPWDGKDAAMSAHIASATK
jgi:ubiquinone/menaquinone biosynthesis C-methylase UbiE